MCVVGLGKRSWAFEHEQDWNQLRIEKIMLELCFPNNLLVELYKKIFALNLKGWKSKAIVKSGYLHFAKCLFKLWIYRDEIAEMIVIQWNQILIHKVLWKQKKKHLFSSKEFVLWLSNESPFNEQAKASFSWTLTSALYSAAQKH